MSTGEKGLRESRSDGQATVLVLLFIVVLLIGVFVLYNVGQLTSSKMKLQNAADATAYSAAVMVARDYNFASYLNRGMVANQVAIAQIVGLSSWSRYYCTVFNQTCGRFPTDSECIYVLPSAPTSCGAYGPLSEDVDFLKVEFDGGGTTNYNFEKPIYAALSKALYTAINAAGPGLVDAMNGIVKIMSGAEVAYDGLLETDFLEALANRGALAQILHANDAQARLQSPLGIGTFSLSATQSTESFIHRYTPLNQKDDPQNRFHEVVVADLDPFSNHRSGAGNYEEFLPFPFDWAGSCDVDGEGDFFMDATYGSKAPYFPVQRNSLLYTTLSANNNNWTAGDEALFFGAGVCVIQVPTPVGDIPVPLPIIVPAMGFFGSDYAYTGQGVSWPAQYKVGTYSGLQPYYDVKNLSNADPASPTLTLLVSRQGSTIDTTANSATLGSPLGAPAGTTQEGALPLLRLSDHEADGALEAVSSADAYFARPQSDWRLGGYVVYGNLFNPYWEAHLVPVPTGFRSAAAMQQGGL